MTKLLARAAMGTALMASASGSVWAHHSHSMFAFANPHVYLFVLVKNEDGTATTWQIEMSYLQNMMRHGINATTFKEGDAVTVKFHPLRDGAPGGSFTEGIDGGGRDYNLR